MIAGHRRWISGDSAVAISRYRARRRLCSCTRGAIVLYGTLWILLLGSCDRIAGRLQQFRRRFAASTRTPKKPADLRRDPLQALRQITAPLCAPASLNWCFVSSGDPPNCRHDYAKRANTKVVSVIIYDLNESGDLARSRCSGSTLLLITFAVVAVATASRCSAGRHADRRLNAITRPARAASRALVPQAV